MTRRTVDGEVHENHFKTVDVDDAHPDRQRPGDAPTAQVVTVRGNEITVTYDSNGVPMRFQATITEQYPNISRVRESSESERPSGATARDGRTGVDHDSAPDQSYDGGHAAGHQFFPGLGRDNMFPQESGFNRQRLHAARERRWPPGRRAGAHVELRRRPRGHPQRRLASRRSPTDVDGTTVQQVPDRVTIQVRYSDADGNVVALRPR